MSSNCEHRVGGVRWDNTPFCGRCGLPMPVSAKALLQTIRDTPEPTFRELIWLRLYQLKQAIKGRIGQTHDQ